MRVGTVLPGLVLAAAAVSTGCGGGTPPGTSPPPSISAPAAAATPPATPSPAAPTPLPTPSGPAAPAGELSGGEVLADGRHPVRITRVSAAERKVTVDVVQFFTGAAADRAAAQDGSAEVPPPNDYWIRNSNPRLRILTVAEGALITVNTLAAAQTGSAVKDVPRTLGELARLDVRQGLFWITVRNGRVTRIAEQYLP